MTFFDNLITPELDALRTATARWAERHILPNAVQWEEQGTFPRELYNLAARDGILGVGFDPAVGGVGGGPLEAVMITEGLLGGGSSGVAASLGSLAIALPPIVQADNPDLVERFVRPALSGARIAALGVTEPGTGSDVAAVATRARRDGDHYVVDGAKLYITSGVRADFVTTLVRTGDDPHGGLSFLVIERGTPGFNVSEPLRKTGWWASDTAELSFDGCRVPAHNLAGHEGGAFITLMRNFQNERLMLAAYGVATAQMALDETLRWIHERRAFGRPLAGFQVLRHKVVDMATRVLAARTLTYQVAHRMAQGDIVTAEVSMAKNVAAETAVSVCYDAVQVHGGMGYMRETLVERLSRDARILPIGGGTQEIMKEIIARQMGL